MEEQSYKLPKCPCGVQHSVDRERAIFILNDIALHGSSVPVRSGKGAQASTYRIPRLWIYFHPLDARTLEENVGRFGWRKESAQSGGGR